MKPVRTRTSNSSSADPRSCQLSCQELTSARTPPNRLAARQPRGSGCSPVCAERLLEAAFRRERPCSTARTWRFLFPHTDGTRGFWPAVAGGAERFWPCPVLVRLSDSTCVTSPRHPFSQSCPVGRCGPPEWHCFRFLQKRKSGLLLSWIELEVSIEEMFLKTKNL